MSKGIDVRATSSELLLRAFLQDSAGAIVTTGPTSLYLYELQMSDGSLKSYDFNDNTFKATALTTETASMTHRTGNNSTTNTGIWTYRLDTLPGFTAGNIYLARVKNAGASPTDQVREFQYGGAEGDFTVTNALLDVNTKAVNGTAQTARDLGLSVLLSSGTGTGQLDVTSGVVKANLAQILGTALTETAGQIAAAFKQFFDIATPTGTVNSLTTILNRIGAFTGSGINTILGMLRAIMRSDTALTPSDVGGTYDNTTKGLEAIAASGAAPVFPSFTVVADAGNTALTFKTDRTETADNYWKDSYVTVTSGALIEQVKRCNGYNGTTKFVTLQTPLTGTPAAGVTMEFINK